MLHGGLSELNEADKYIRKICDIMKEFVEFKVKKYDVFTAINYKNQLVNGTNYFIKVHVGGDEYLHICIYKTLPCNRGAIELINLEQHKHRDDPIEYIK